MSACNTLMQSAVIALAVFALVANCAKRERIGADEEFRYEGFLKDGHTTKSEVEARLGPPRSVFEEGKVLIYRVFMDDQGRMTLKFQSGQVAFADCSVCVLAFDQNDVLARHSILRNGCR